MGLNASALESDILEVFQSMTDDDDKVFSEGISAAVKNFAESGGIATADAGTVSAGVYAGAGSGGITVDASVSEQIIHAACVVMRNMTTGGNTYLAMQIAAGIHAMILTGEVETDVTGQVTPPGGLPVALNGSAAGTMTGVPLPMQTAFANAYDAMDSMESGGDEYMAAQMATAINTYMTTAVVATSGSGALSGSVGAGAMA